jgi:hypothetical protein
VELASCSFVEVLKDLTDDVGVGDEGENFHPCPAAGAGQRVDLVDAVDELSPAFAQSAPGSRLGRLTLGPGSALSPARYVARTRLA